MESYTGISMSNILTVLRLGELMTEMNLTWQAAALVVVVIAIGVGFALMVIGKGIKAIRDAFR